MQKNHLLFLISLLVGVTSLFYSSFEAEAQAVFAKRPTWRQEFTSTKQRPLTNWGIFIGKYSFEDQFYTDSIGNVYIKNGKLHLKATPDKRADKVCSSGRVTTKGYQSFLYGKLEIRAKVPTGKGIFPAIWMLREDHGSVFPLGEIDIMEYVECFEQKQYSTTTHIVEKEPGKKEIRHKHSTRVNTDVSKFHIYGLEWTPTQLRFLLDRKEVYRLDKKDAEFWPFEDPYILILNVAYGSWGAQCGMDESIFPVEMLVDWIRYYSLI